MTDRFTCLACGIEVSEADKQCCPDCGAELVAKEEVSPVSGKKKLGTVIALLGLIGAIFLVWQSGIARLDGATGHSSKEQAIAKIQNEALEINSQVPLMIDQSTRLDRIVIEAETIICKSTLVNFTAEKAGGDIFEKEIAPFLAGQYCNKKNTRNALELGVKYGHEYFGRDGALLYTTTISLEDC